MTHAPNTETEEELLLFSALTFEELFAAFTMMIIVVAVSWGVITRYLLSSPADWTSELAAMAFAWTVFIGAAAAFARGEHSSVDALIVKLPAPYRQTVQMIADFIVLVTLIAVALLATRFAFSTMDVGTTVMGVPQGITYAAAASGFALMSIRHVTFVVLRFRRNGGQS